VIIRSPEQFDRRGRTQGYQAIFTGRSRRRPPQAPEQLDLFSVLDDAELAASEEVYESGSDSTGNAVSQEPDISGGDLAAGGRTGADGHEGGSA
jgi:hypothetical protein